MTDNDIPLLHTKLHRPRPASDLVVRPRLLALLDRDLDCQVTLVSAPAGFGKTTLVSSWIEGVIASPSPSPAAWLSLDESDSDLNVFLTYFAAALRTLFPGACDETLGLLQAPRQAPLKYLTTTLSNEIQRLPSNFILVLDDYHLIRGEAIPNLLNGLLNHWPETMHLVLISRTSPALPLSKLRVRGALNEIRSRDLRFTKEETAAFLDQALQASLSEAAVEKLEERTEGWIAALRLAVLSLRKASDVNDRIMNLAIPDEGIADYLVHEVLAQQFPALQKFLLKTSILDQFCAPLCEAVIGESDPAWSVRACIDWLERAELFLIPLDERKEWYRYHQLFREALQQRLLSDLGADVVTDLHCRAAEWLAGRGLVDEALQHAVQAGDLDLVARLMEQGLRDVLNREDRSTLERWGRLLPDAYMQNRPWLLMVKAWAFQFAWQIGPQWAAMRQLEALLEKMDEAAFSPDALQILRGQLFTLQGQQAYFNNQSALCVSRCQEALSLIPQSWAYLRGGAMTYLGFGMQASGQGEAAERLLRDAYESLGDKTDSYALRLLFTLCFNYLNSGQLERAREVASVMLRQAVGRLPIMQGWAHFFLGMVYYERNDLDAAGQHFAELRDQRYKSHALSGRNGMAGLALIQQSRGESAEARGIAGLLSQFDLEQTGSEGDGTRSLHARLSLVQGDVDNACRWADAYTTPPPDAPLLWLEEPQLTRARILVARGGNADLHAALQILDALQEIAGRTFNARFTIHIQALRAVTLDALGKTQQALAALEQAVELARPGGFIRAFLDLGPRMPQLLGELAQQGNSGEWIQRILAALSQTESLPENSAAPVAAAPHPPPALVEPLTRRELEILALLRQPVSFKEIAFKLGISYATVKRHSINLYAKLAVSSRWDAVAKAVELGILPAS